MGILEFLTSTPIDYPLLFSAQVLLAFALVMLSYHDGGTYTSANSGSNKAFDFVMFPSSAESIVGEQGRRRRDRLARKEIELWLL